VTTFPDHTMRSAPPASRQAMEATTNRLGYLPAAVARMAASPELLNGFLRMSALFDTTTLEPMAREAVILTVAARHGCHICIAMHSAKLTALGAGADVVTALRDARPVPDERLAAAGEFTTHVLDTAGAVGDEALGAFLAHGFTARNALEVVLGIGAYTMSTLANRMTGAPLDYQLAALA
jgi:AhpD family alkylhydroperoxidase